MMRLFKLLILSILVLTMVDTVYTASKLELRYGGKTNNWKFTTFLKNTQEQLSRNGSKEIVLIDNEYMSDGSVDLLIHFNGPNKNTASNDLKDTYTIIKHNFHYDSRRKVFGSAAGKFMHPSNTLILRPKPKSFFNKTQHCGSFTIEFWLNPAILSDGEVIFSKYGPVIKNNMISNYSGIICKIERKRLLWELRHIFHKPNYTDELDQDTSVRKIKITSPRRIKSKRWSHHALSFDSLSGKLTYYINGREVKSQFITESGQAEDTVLTPKFYPQEKSMLVIGKKFYGFLDEFMISKVSKTSIPKLLRFPKENIRKKHFNTQKYIALDGEVTSKVVDLEMTGSYLKRVKLNVEEKRGSNIILQYRLSQDFFKTDNRVVPWQNIDVNNPAFLIRNKITGRFFQWQAILKRGENGNFTPVLKEVSFQFNIDKRPSSPKNLVAFSSEGRVYLRWRGNIERDIAAYKIYYGIAKGNYLGDEQSIDIEPYIVNVNSLSDKIRPVYIISNLKPNKVYYFTVTAVDKNGHESQSSNEVSVKVRMMK